MFKARSLIWFGLGLGLAACSPARGAAPPVTRSADVASGQLPTVASCAGLSEEARRTSLFKEHLAAVEPLLREQRVGARNRIERPAGATLLLAATPDRNAQWLERVAKCQLETFRASGISTPDEPMSVPGASVSVRELTGGYAIDVRSDDVEAAREIRSRAESLLSRR